MKKVLHLLPSNSFSGAENVVCTIINNDDKYDMYYCCPKGSIEQILKDRKIKYISIDRLNPRSVRKICKQYEIDILHAHDYKASVIAVLSRFSGKIISHIHSHWDFICNWNKYTIIYNLALKRIDKVIVVSNKIVEDAIYAKKNKDKFVVIDNVIDKNYVINQSKQEDTKKYDIIYVGRLCEVKNPLMLIDIANLVKQKIPNIKMAIIGTGDLEEECESKIKKLNLENNIEMLGFKSNPFPYIKNSNLALLPSKHEGLPMSIVECMILNVPVLNSGVDGLGILFKKFPEFICINESDYCEKIINILEGKLDLKGKCPKIIEKYIDMNNYIDSINKVYEE